MFIATSPTRGDRGRRRPAPRRWRGDRLDRDQPDRPVQGRLRHHRRVCDRRGGRALGFRLSRSAGGASDHRQRAQRDAGRGISPNSAAAHRGSPISARSRRSLPTRRSQRASPICHTRGIEVVEAMEKPAADIDEAGPDAVPALRRCGASRSPSKREVRLSAQAQRGGCHNYNIGTKRPSNFVGISSMFFT